MRRTKVVEIAGTDIHQELGELAEFPGFRLVALQVMEWRPGSIDRWMEAVRWLVVYESTTKGL